MLAPGTRSGRYIQTLTDAVAGGATLQSLLQSPAGVSLRQRALSIREWLAFRDACTAAGVTPSLATYAQWREGELT